jgi:hypothetical protein
MDIYRNKEKLKKILNETNQIQVNLLRVLSSHTTVFAYGSAATVAYQTDQEQYDTQSQQKRSPVEPRDVILAVRFLIIKSAVVTSVLDLAHRGTG